MAGALNNFFASVFTVENMQNIPEPRKLTDAELRHVNFSSKEISDKIMSLKSHSAPGPDGITVRILQDQCTSLSEALCIVFNKSMHSGVVPEDWRRANITPIFKKGSKSDTGNYRPISLTSIPCKIMESIIRDRTMTFLLNHKLIKGSQHGFMNKKSTTTNLLEFLEKVTNSYDDNEPVDIIYFDFSKAFDKVPWARLALKLEAHGLKGNLLAWFKNWLNDRKQRVVLNGQASEWEIVISGVPQGSVLGPLAFLIFINDLDDIDIDILCTLKFADDTKVANNITTNQHHNNLQEVIDKMFEWSECWGMEFNVQKCKVLHVGKNNPEYTYSMNGIQLNSVEYEKDIGIYIDQSLKPSRHCNEAVKRANAVLTQISKSFHFRDRHIFKKLYITYVRPHVENVSPAWNPWLRKDVDLIEKVQKRTVNMISGLIANTYEEKLIELNLESLEYRRTKLDMVQTFKILKNIDKVDERIWFTRANDYTERNTRLNNNRDNLFRSKVSRTEVRNKFFSQRVINIWNNLPDHVKTATKVEQFKKLYDEHFSNQESGTDDNHS